MSEPDVMEEVLWHIDADFEKEGWDLRPELLAVWVHVTSPDTRLIEIKPMPGWDMTIEKSSSAREALERLLWVYSRAPAGMTSAHFEGVHGVALVAESWMLREVSREEMEKVSKTRTIHDHPDRVEVRFIHYTSRDGLSHSLQHEREGIVEPIEGAEGFFPDALQALVKVLIA